MNLEHIQRLERRALDAQRESIIGPFFTAAEVRSLIAEVYRLRSVVREVRRTVTLNLEPDPETPSGRKDGTP